MNDVKWNESQALCQSSDTPNNITYYKMSRDYKYYKTCILSKSISIKEKNIYYPQTIMQEHYSTNLRV